MLLCRSGGQEGDADGETGKGMLMGRQGRDADGEAGKGMAVFSVCHFSA